jgi:hypothetical protein
MPPNLGRGAQGAATIKEIVNRSAEITKGQSTDDTIANRQETKAEQRARLELGAREGKIAPRVEEAKQFAIIAKQASADVPRGDSQLFNSWIQGGEKKFSSDPKLRKFVAANTSLINAYAAATSGGSPTVSDKEHARDMLATAFSKGDYNAAVDQMIVESEAALKAPKTVMKGMRSKEGTLEQTNHPQDIQNLLDKYK